MRYLFNSFPVTIQVESGSSNKKIPRHFLKKWKKREFPGLLALILSFHVSVSKAWDLGTNFLFVCLFALSKHTSRVKWILGCVHIGQVVCCVFNFLPLEWMCINEYIQGKERETGIDGDIWGIPISQWQIQQHLLNFLCTFTLH